MRKGAVLIFGIIFIRISFPSRTLYPSEVIFFVTCPAVYGTSRGTMTMILKHQYFLLWQEKGDTLKYKLLSLVTQDQMTNQDQ